MAQYACCYSSGRQFIFTERPKMWILVGLLAVAMCGLVVGLCIGVTVNVAGPTLFESVMVSVGLATAYNAYLLTFKRISGSLDTSGYVFMCVVFAGVLGALLAIVRYLLYLDSDPLNRCLLFSASGVVLGLLVYGYVNVAFLEDQRKHFLGLCSPTGEAFGSPLSQAGDELTIMGRWRSFIQFVRWILSWQWWLDLHDWSVAADEESRSDDCITVHNHTLKLIKVCLYSPGDMFCWVPFGGIAGRCVGLIEAEGQRSFRLPHRLGAEDPLSSDYQLKVFQPGVLDKELACYSQARRGQSFAFYDVEGMVRRSRLLSSAASSWPQPSPVVGESSDDEGVELRQLSPTFLTLEKAGAATMGPSGALTPPKAAAEGRTLLRRNCSAGSMMDLQDAAPTLTRSPTTRPRREAPSAPSSSSTSSSDSCQAAPSRPEARKASPDEVVVRNRSNQEIRALLFRSNDYCYMVPLVGRLMACGDCILPDEERRFNLQKTTTARDFTLKVYSVGPGARELTYLTVSRGHTYTFCDSLLS